MKKSEFILLIILILPLSLFAQEEKGKTVAGDTANLFINRLESGSMPGKVKIIQDPRLTNILRKHFEFNKTTGSPGWRILIYKGREMSRANQMKAEFEEAFGQLSLQVNVEYNEPDFSTLVGGFRTKQDAFRYKQMLIVRFPQAYLVQSRIMLD
ncbi:MAG: hypothetical protein WC699_09615 [Bacteroidales bacterium]|jgi:hypothetical protein